MTGPLSTLTFTTAVGCAAVGGIFLAFSTFVMKGLGRLPAAQGAAAMRSVNVTAVTPPFMLVLFATAALCVGLGIRAILTWNTAGSAWILAGALIYLIGVVALTAGYHVPRNDALAAADPNSADGQALWASYLVDWTRVNHLRAAAGLAAAASLIVGATR